MEKAIKPVSKKLRKEIYLKAIDNIQDTVGYKFLCGQLETIIRDSGFEINGIDEVVDYLPEFGMFKPTIEERNEYGLISTWFAADEYEYYQLERLVCLDMCLQLLK